MVVERGLIRSAVDVTKGSRIPFLVTCRASARAHTLRHVCSTSVAAASRFESPPRTAQTPGKLRGPTHASGCHPARPGQRRRSPASRRSRMTSIAAVAGRALERGRGHRESSAIIPRRTSTPTHLAHLPGYPRPSRFYTLVHDAAAPFRLENSRLSLARADATEHQVGTTGGDHHPLRRARKRRTSPRPRRLSARDHFCACLIDRLAPAAWRRRRW